MPRFKVRIEGGDLERAAEALRRSGFVINPDVTVGQAFSSMVEAETPEKAESRVRESLPKGDYVVQIAGRSG